MGTYTSIGVRVLSSRQGGHEGADTHALSHRVVSEHPITPRREQRNVAPYCKASSWSLSGHSRQGHGVTAACTSGALLAVARAQLTNEIAHPLTAFCRE